MDKSIYHIIKQEDISTLYQPIVNLITGEIMGYEALSRGPEWSRFFSPETMIFEAERCELSEELEYVMRKKAIENVNGLMNSQRLFINVNPNIMKKDSNRRGQTLKLLEEKNIFPSNVVLELTERSMIKDYSVFNDILTHYKNQDYKIAIDDVGTGYSGLITIKETKPHYIKIDMDLIRDIDKDLFKEALINAFLNFSITTNIKLIAEGIETEAELAKLINMGVHYGQGYFLQRPNKTLTPLRQDVLDTIKNNNYLQKDLNLFNDAKAMIGPVVNKHCFVNKTAICSDIVKSFEDSACEGLCITENNIPIGIIMRENLLVMLSSRYGLSLYAKKQIKYVMDTEFLMVDYHTSISQVSKKAMAREKTKTYDIIIVTKDGEFYGLISINTLLQNLLTVETQEAKELNPLTKLPGNIIINRVLNDIILYKPQCCIVYLDFDFFKPYNDIYGFEYGDQFIKKVSDIILSEIKTTFPYNSFIGHIGGDDFIFVLETSREAAIKICQQIINKFEAQKKELYTLEDYNNGYIISKNRKGIIKKFNLVTLSISGFYNNLNQFSSVEALSKHMSLLKKDAKNIDGNSIIIK